MNINFLEKDVKIISYKSWTNKEITAFINSVKRQYDNDYLFFADADGATIDAKLDIMERKFENRYFGQKRVVFVGRKGKGGKFTYTFAGIFVGQGYDEEGKMYYKCIDDKFKIVR